MSLSADVFLGGSRQPPGGGTWAARSEIADYLCAKIHFAPTPLKATFQKRMKPYSKRDFPVSKIRQLLEPGPVVLVSSAWKEKTNIMTMGWHAVIEITPPLVGCVIAESNVSFEMIRKSRECVINVPTLDIVDKVVSIGNCDGDEIDKFKRFHLTLVAGSKVAAPLIRECYANLECRIHDVRLVKEYNFFILEVVKATSPLHQNIPAPSTIAAKVNSSPTGP